MVEMDLTPEAMKREARRGIAALVAQAGEKIPASNAGGDIDAVIAAARILFGKGKIASADAALAAADRDEAAQARQRRLPLLKELAFLRGTTFNFSDARESLAKLAQLIGPDCRAWIGLGDEWQTKGSLWLAAEAFVAARKASDHPPDAMAARSRLGDVTVEQGNLAEAAKLFREGLAVAETLIKADPGNAGWRRDLSVPYNKLGDVFVAQGNLAEALKCCRAGLSIAEALSKADLGNAGWRRDLSVFFNKYGDVFFMQGILAEALKSYCAGFSIAEALSKDDPGNAGWRRDVAISRGKLGGLHAASGNRSKAQAEYAAGRAIMWDLTALSPDNAIWRDDLANFEARLAELG